MQCSIKILILSLVSSYLFCQNENNIWLFPPSTRVEFNSEKITVKIENNKFHLALAGHSIVCDTLGNLLFYTDGSNIYDKNHQLIDAGGPILGEENYSIQGALVIKSKENKKYFLISLNDFKPESNGDLVVRTIKLDDNDKPFVLPNSKIKIGDGFMQSMVAIRHPCGGHWILVHERNNNVFVAIHFYEGKVLTTYKSAIGKVPELRMSSFSYSDSLAILVAQYWQSSSEAFKFDVYSGALSDMISFYQIRSGISGNFSPNGRYFYFTGGSSGGGGSSLDIVQYDFSNYDSQQIELSGVSLPFPKSMWDDTVNTLGVSSIMRGPLNKLYFSAAGQIYSRGTIHNPDVRGIGFKLEHRSIVSPVEISSRQIPTPIVQSNPVIENFLPKDTLSCKQHTFILKPNITYDSLRWQDGSKNSQITITQDGVYSLELYKNGCRYTDTFTYKISPTLKSQSVYICSNEEYVYKSRKYPVGSFVLDTIKGIICDTILKINVESRPSRIVKDSVFVCQGSSYTHTDGRQYKPGEFILTDKKGKSGDCDTVLFIFINSFAKSSLPPLDKRLVCFGDSIKIAAPAGFLKYEWSNGSISPVQYLKKGDYTLTVTDINNCKNTTTLSVSELPSWTIQLDRILKIYQGQDSIFALKGMVDRIKKFKISPSISNLTVIGSDLIVKGITSNQDIVITFIDTMGCVVDVPLTLEVISESEKIVLPNVILRNSQNPLNEIFKVGVNSNTELISLAIFDRWGNKVYQSSNTQETWNTEKISSDTYIFRIETRSKSGKLKIQVGSILVTD